MTVLQALQAMLEDARAGRLAYFTFAKLSGEELKQTTELLARAFKLVGCDDYESRIFDVIEAQPQAMAIRGFQLAINKAKEIA